MQTAAEVASVWQPTEARLSVGLRSFRVFGYGDYWANRSVDDYSARCSTAQAASWERVE